MKAVADCAHFANTKPKVRETYMRCIGLLVKETSIDEAKRIIHSVLVMAYSETEGTFESIHFIMRKNSHSSYFGAYKMCDSFQ